MTSEWRGMDWLAQLSRTMIYNFFLNLPGKPETLKKMICWQASVNSGWKGRVGVGSFILFWVFLLLFFFLPRKYQADFHAKLEFHPVERGWAGYAVEVTWVFFFSWWSVWQNLYLGSQKGSNLQLDPQKGLSNVHNGYWLLWIELRASCWELLCP